MMFNVVKVLVNACRKSMSNMLVSEMHNFNKSRKHGMILPITFFKNYANPINNANDAKVVIVKDETANPDPRVDSTNALDPNYEDTLSNMNIQKTSNVNNIKCSNNKIYDIYFMDSKIAYGNNY